MWFHHFAPIIASGGAAGGAGYSVGGITLPASVPDPVIWFSPRFVTLSGGNITAIPNQGTGGATYDATPLTANQATIATPSSWGGREVFNLAETATGGYGFTTLTEGRTMATLATYRTGTETTFSAFEALVSGPTGGATTELEVIGQSGGGGFFGSKADTIYYDGVALSPNTATVLPMFKRGVIGVETGTTSQVGQIWADNFSTSRRWIGQTGDIIIWAEELDATQAAAVHDVLAAYYFAENPVSFAGKTVVFALAGQSNMIGRYGPINTGGPDATDPDIAMINHTTPTIVTAADPLDHFDETANTVGPGLTFAKTIKSNHTPDKIILVGLAEGGTGFIARDWDVGGLSNTYTAARARWISAWSKIQADETDVVLGGLLWLQGEDEVQDFNARLSDDGRTLTSMHMNLFRTIRENWTGFTDETPIVTGSLPPGATLTAQSSYASVQAAIAALPTTFPLAASADGSDLGTGDGVHYSAAAARTLGTRMAQAYPDAVYSEVAYTAVSFTPDVDNVETLFAINAVGHPDGGPVLPLDIAQPMDNELVYIDDGKFQFNGFAELRLTNTTGERITFGTSDFVIKATVYFDAVSGVQGIIGTYESTGNEKSWALRASGTTLAFLGSSDGSTDDINLTATIAATTEYDIEVRRDGTSIELYVDAVLEDSAVIASDYFFNVPASSVSTLIGDFEDGNKFSGYIESLSVEQLSVPVPDGDEQTFAIADGALSTSNYAVKGNRYLCNTARFLTKLQMATTTAGQTVRWGVAEIDNLDVIQSILLYGEEFVTVSGSNETTLASPIYLEPGKYYAFVAIRPDNGTLAIQSTTGTITDPNGHFTRQGVARHNLATWTVGGDLTYASSATWSIDITTEASSG